MWMRRMISLFFIFSEWAARGGWAGGRCQNFEHRPPPTFCYCLWIARGFYPNDIIPLLPEQSFVARTNPKILRGLACALSESAFQCQNKPSLREQTPRFLEDSHAHWAKVLLNTDHHLRFVTVCGLRVVFIPTISYLHCQQKTSLREQTPRFLED